MKRRSEHTSTLRTVAVIGAGLAGRAFAFRCAEAGLDVVLEDVMPSNLRHAQVQYSQSGDVEGVARISYSGSVEDAVRTADIAVDFVPDELESKLEIWSMLDRMAPPRTILCTPTRALSVTDLASCTYRPDKCVALKSTGAELPLGDAVEVVRSRFLSEATANAVEEFLSAIRLRAKFVADDLEPMLVKNVHTL